jgi:periplasmic divalent cation tolerance protein
MSRQKPLLALVTVPDIRTGRKLAQAALKARLAACANLLPGLESHFWWEGRIQRSPEVLVLFKTTSGKAAALERLILDLHPYDTPEFVLVPPAGGNKRYLDWWLKSVTAHP